MSDAGPHADIVADWVGGVRGLAPEAALERFDRLVSTLWDRARWTLGEITLTAIADRVAHSATGRFPLDPVMTVEGDEWRRVDRGERPSARVTADLARWMQFVLCEYLTVIGSLTAEVLTPALHALIRRDAAPQDAEARGAVPGTAETEKKGSRS